MKLLPSLFVLLSIAQSFAQIPTKAIALEDNAFDSYFLTRKIPVVKGKIFNLTPDEIKQTKIDCSIVTPFASFQQKKTIDLNADGTFEIKLDYAFPYQQVWMSAGDLFFTG